MGQEASDMMGADQKADAINLVRQADPALSLWDRALMVGLIRRGDPVALSLLSDFQLQRDEVAGTVQWFLRHRDEAEALAVPGVADIAAPEAPNKSEQRLEATSTTVNSIDNSSDLLSQQEASLHVSHDSSRMEENNNRPVMRHREVRLGADRKAETVKLVKEELVKDQHVSMWDKMRIMWLLGIGDPLTFQTFSNLQRDEIAGAVGWFLRHRDEAEALAAVPEAADSPVAPNVSKERLEATSTGVNSIDNSDKLSQQEARLHVSHDGSRMEDNSHRPGLRCREVRRVG